MKKILFILFAVSLLVTKGAFAQYEDVALPTEQVSQTPSPTPIVEYQLPYPGILPGSPLYSLKALRDRLIEMFISDPLKKANFYLLQSDKRLASSLVLFEKGDKEKKEAQSTFSKGQNYLEKSINSAKTAKNSQLDIGEVAARIKLSAGKQRQELLKLSKKSTGDLKKDFEAQYKRALELEKSANQLKP